jgi:energy-coupling factor transporter ATP-binding protein EcfA2
LEAQTSVLAEALRFAYPPPAPGEAVSWVIDGLDLHVRSGEWLAIMGASDVGKTTLCLLLAGLAPHLTGGTMEGHVVVTGRDTRLYPPPALADSVGVLFQEAEAQLFSPTVEAELAWGLENLGLPVTDMQQRIDEMLVLLRLERLRHRAPTELSGGEKKRLALASVLAMRPTVLILDEPMGGLDPAGQNEVLDALSRLRHAGSVTILMTESDPEAVATFADRLVILDQGRIALEGSPRDLFRQVERLAALGVSVPQMAQVAAVLNRRLGTAFDFLSVDEAQANLHCSLSERRRESVEVPPDPPPPPPGSSLQVSDLWFWYESENAPALRGVDLDVPGGQFVALVGANGSGKTTLVKHLNGLLRPRRGRVSVGGQDTSQYSVGELARSVGFLFQHPEQQIFSATVQKEVAFGPHNLSLSPEEVESRVESALTRFGLTAVAQRPPAILSYGLRRRITLASLAAMDPPVLVLDEPTVGLDAPGLRETFQWLAELHARGRTILLVTHDMALAAEYAERIVVLHQGEIIGDGPPADLFGQHGVLARASLALPPVIALAQALRPYGLRGESLTVDTFCQEYLALVGEAS